QHNILRSLGTRLDQARANVVFFDVQESQQAGIDSIVRGGRYEMIDQTPIVPMRISSINGRPSADIITEVEKTREAERAIRRAGGRGPRTAPSRERRGPWALRREFRSTYRDTLTESEQIVAGRWFSASRGDSL